MESMETKPHPLLFRPCHQSAYSEYSTDNRIGSTASRAFSDVTTHGDSKTGSISNSNRRFQKLTGHKNNFVQFSARRVSVNGRNSGRPMLRLDRLS